MTEYKDIPSTFPLRDGAHNQLIDSDGCGHDTKADFIQCGLLGLCGCGQPSDHLLFLLHVLEHVEWRHTSDTSRMDKVARDAWWALHNTKVKALFGETPGADYFMWYWLDVSGLTEHGGSVLGWLSDNGKNLLTLLRSFKANPDG